MGDREINAYWRRDSQYYQQPRSPEDIAEQQRLYNQAQDVGAWEQSHQVPDIQRLTWWYSDFGSFVPKDYVTAEALTLRHSEIIKIKQKESEGKMVKPPSEETVGWLQTQFGDNMKEVSISMDTALEVGGNAETNIPSVLARIRDAKLAPKEPRKDKPERKRSESEL